MKTLRFDSVGGASGDMILGALTDLGADITAIKKQLSSLEIDDFDIPVQQISYSGFCGTSLSVTVVDNIHPHHRHLGDILALIKGSNLPDNVMTMSMKVFERLAKAEAEVHGTTIDKVHFHEVGAMDTIIDVVGSCIALDMLKIDSVQAGPLPIGQGTTKCEHGIIPLPAPATLALLKDYPVIQTEEPFEMVTPTGAALLMEWTSTMPTNNNPCTITKTGNGFGSRKLNSRPNMLRATIMESTPIAHTPNQCTVLECNIDDTIPELLGAMTQKLIKKGALDVFTTPVQMKKQRPGTLLTVLCRPDDRESLKNIIFTESTTFGIREHMTQRTILKRRHTQVETPYGSIRIKVGTWNDKDITHAPEHDDCAKCAEKHNVPVRIVYEAAIRAS